MKATGVVKRTDDLGRFGFPIELRRTMNINPGDSIEIFTDGSKIMLRKYEPACVFCGEANEVYFFRDKNVCLRCIRELLTKVKA